MTVVRPAVVGCLYFCETSASRGRNHDAFWPVRVVCPWSWHMIRLCTTVRPRDPMPLPLCQRHTERAINQLGQHNGWLTAERTVDGRRRSSMYDHARQMCHSIRYQQQQQRHISAETKFRFLVILNCRWRCVEQYPMTFILVLLS